MRHNVSRSVFVLRTFATLRDVVWSGVGTVLLYIKAGSDSLRRPRMADAFRFLRRNEGGTLITLELLIASDGKRDV
eukprot:5381888-Pyramimonas_sp.AAC.1